MEPFTGTQLAKWKQLIGQHLGRPHTKRTVNLMLDLLSVDCGLKPALLLDFAVSDASRVESLVGSLKLSGLLTKRLVVVTIELDVLIMNPMPLDCPGNISLFSSVSFVDVSPSLKHPQGLAHDSDNLHPTKNCFQRFLEEQNTSHESSLDLPVMGQNDTPANPSTLFGLFLGYPVVYYYDMGQESEDNCLGMIPLVNFIVKGTVLEAGDKYTISREHAVFSFSVPEMLVSLFHADIDAWFMKMRDSKVWCNVFSTLELERRVVQLPRVCL